MMLLFPYIFGRSGGEAIDKLKNLKVSNLLFENINSINTLNIIINDKELNLITLLFEIIKDEKDSKLQNKLLNLKRDLYNHKNLTSYVPMLEAGFKYSEFYNLFLSYLNLLKEKRNLLTEAQKLYLENTNEALNQLGLLYNNKYLRNGILFSSEKLDGILEEYDSTNLRHQRKKDVFALLKYATRSLTKTTPFSTFNKTFCLNKVNQRYESLDSTERFRIKINNYIFLYIKRLLLYIPEVSNQFYISVNSSLIEDADYYKFFINIENNDHLNKIKKNPICSYIIDLSYNNKNLTLDSLIHAIINQTDEPVEKIVEYLNELIKRGLLVLHFPTSIYNENWHCDLIEYIKDNFPLNDNQLIRQVKALLQILDEVRCTLQEDLDHDIRKLSLTQALNIFDQLRKEVLNLYPHFPFHDTSKIITINDLFYEDYVNNQYASTLDNVESLVTRFSEMQSKLSLFDEKKHFRGQIAEIIKTEFNNTSISLLSFFETFCLNKKQINGIMDEKFIDIVKTEQGTVLKIKNAIECSNGKDVDIEVVLKDENVTFSNAGFGIYFQIFDEHKKQVCVINNESHGWGKNISRFLNCYDEKIAQDISSKIQAQYSDCIIADIHDASINNLNIYPKLTNYLIEISGGEEDNRGYTKLKLDELLLKIEEDDVYLTWQGKRVLPIHFSMENIDRKSSLIKLIEVFSVSAMSGLSTIKLVEALLIKNIEDLNQNIMVVPRLIYGDNIVLSRKKWLVKKSVFLDFSSKRIGDHDSFNSYIEIIKWKNQNEIPDEVFVKLAKIPAYPKNLHKPQYVNFQVSLLVECFLSMLQEADDIIEISEMMPNSNEINQDLNGEKYVREYIMNIA